MDTFEEMREQLQLLHHKIDGQEIVDERHIRRAVGMRVRSINRQAAVMLFMSLFAIPYSAWALRFIGLSWPFAVVTMAFLAVALFYTAWSHRKVRSSQLATEPLREVARRVARMKRRYARWLYFSIPFLVGWVSWFACEIMGNTDIPYSERIGVMTGAAIGGLTGIVLGFMAYRRTQRLAREILEQIQ